MLSRVADSLYWMARQIERAENLARLMEVINLSGLDMALSTNKQVRHYWLPVLQATACDELFSETHGENACAEDILEFMNFSKDNPDSIRNCIAMARENARMVRDKISVEMWLELNLLYLFVKSDEARDLSKQSPTDFYERIIQSSLLFQGITDATIPRQEGWEFVQLGKYLERADKTSRILDIPNHCPSTENAVHWAAILRSCSAQAAYRQFYGGQATMNQTAELLLFSRSFPRSARFCIKMMDELLHQISGVSAGQFSNEAERLTGSLLAHLNFSAMADVKNQGLHFFVDDFQARLNDIGQQIFESYVLLPKDISALAASNATPLWVQQAQQQQQ